MISVEEALRIVRNHPGSFGSEQVPFEHSLGRILDEDIEADRDFPPYDRAAMDGIAIAMQDWDDDKRSFPLQGEQFAGAPQQILMEGSAMEVMTGAVVPAASDAVIRYEDITIEEGHAHVMIDLVHKDQNIHKQGADAKAGSILIPKGKHIAIGDIGILSTVGKVNVRVKKLPKIAVISTGDELVEPNQLPLPHQIRKSNVYSITVLLKNHSIDYDCYHINDAKEEVSEKLNDLLRSYDVLLMSGGVSKGKRDYVPEVLEALGVKKHFHRITQRPGKPMWFGTKGGTVVFGFPGNPISTLACYAVYFKAWLNASLKKADQPQYAVLGSAIAFEKPLTFFGLVSLENRDETRIAIPLKNGGSGDLVGASMADAFIELPANKTTFKAGEVYPIHVIQ